MLDKAIKYKKEKRKQFRRSKVFDRTCRNNNSCPWCKNNRLYQYNKEQELMKDKLNEYFKEENNL